MTPHTPEAIAAKLTEARKRILIEAADAGSAVVGGRNGRAVEWLTEHGLVSAKWETRFGGLQYHSHITVSPTPLGLEVRALLKSKGQSS